LIGGGLVAREQPEPSVEGDALGDVFAGRLGQQLLERWLTGEDDADDEAGVPLEVGQHAQDAEPWACNATRFLRFLVSRSFP
jgi:hypothetical protein